MVAWVQPVVEAAREDFGIDIVALRLLSAEPGIYNGGAVSYLAELVGEPPRGVTLTNATPGVVGEDQPPARRVGSTRSGGHERSGVGASPTTRAPSGPSSASERGRRSSLVRDRVVTGTSLGSTRRPS